MIQKIIPFLTITFLAFSSFCQVDSIDHDQFISLKEQRSIVDRSKKYKPSITIADSLYSVYNASRFLMEEKDKSVYGSGLEFILNLYSAAREKARNTKYCDSIIANIENQLQQETLEDVEKQYQRIKANAEESYLNGNLDRAIELYERAITLKPTDEQAIKRLAELWNEHNNK